MRNPFSGFDTFSFILGAIVATVVWWALSLMKPLFQQMLEAQRQWLPQFEGKSVRPTLAIGIPKDIQPVEVPLDPALAIANRFGKLAQA